MTNDLQDLLTQYGRLSISLSHLKSERPGSEYASLEEYYASLGAPSQDELCVVVRISKDGETRFLEENEHDVRFKDPEGKQTGRVKVWELPEDEFWFFRAFRPSLFDLTKDLPGYLYQLGVVHAYALFEGYLSQILSNLLRRHPQLMGGQGQLTYKQVFQATTKEQLIQGLVDREIRDLMHLSITETLQKLRDRFGFSSLTEEYDASVRYLSLLRNCLLHNRARVDAKLAEYRPDHKKGDELSISILDVSKAVSVLWKFANQIDINYERIVQ